MVEPSSSCTGSADTGSGAPSSSIVLKPDSGCMSSLCPATCVTLAHVQPGVTPCGDGRQLVHTPSSTTVACHLCYHSSPTTSHSDNSFTLKRWT